jgi:hypothetical protein
VTVGAVSRAEQSTGRAPEYIGSAMSGSWLVNSRVRRVRHVGRGRPSRAFKADVVEGSIDPSNTDDGVGSFGLDGDEVAPRRR